MTARHLARHGTKRQAFITCPTTGNRCRVVNAIEVGNKVRIFPEDGSPFPVDWDAKVTIERRAG